MKVLITESGAILSYGAPFNKGVNSNKIVELEDLTVQELKNICTANNVDGIKSKSTKADIINKLTDHMVINNTEEKEMSDKEKYIEIIKEGFANELADDNIKENMYGAGCPFGEIDKTFKEIVKDLGLRLTAKERAIKTSEFLEGYVPDADDVNSHLAKLAALQDHLKCTSTQAGAAMRKWAKDNDIELPKVPKKPKTEPGFRGKIKILSDWALENKDVTFDELEAYAKENVPPSKTGKDNSHSYAVTVWNAILFAKAWAGETDSEEVVSEDEVEDMVA